MSGPTQFFSGPESVEIGFTDPDLGVMGANTGQKRQYPRLLRGKTGFSLSIFDEPRGPASKRSVLS